MGVNGTGSVSVTNPNTVAVPRPPVFACLVPTVAASDAANLKTFYFGISGWSKQWEAADTAHRKRLELAPIPIDLAHKISTLQTCISTTVAAYTNAAAALATLDPAAPKTIYQGIGHGAAGHEDTGATADFGIQLFGFSQHEYRVAKRTFDMYRLLKTATSFSQPIGTPDPTPKDRAHHLLAFDGLVAIRNAIKGKVSTVRIVSCKIGDDLNFMRDLAWVLGRCQAGEPATNNIVIEAYDVKLFAGQATAAAPFRIGSVIDPNNPKNDDTNIAFAINAQTELPSQHVVRVDPSTISAPNPNDPMSSPTDPVLDTLKLGNCASLASMIPASVLTQ
jgi:hypothetical protein